MHSILQFEKYYIEKMSYSRNNDFWNNIPENYDEAEIEVELKPTFKFDVIVNPETFLQAQVLIGVKIGSVASEVKSPFIAEAVIRGYFEINDESLKNQGAPGISEEQANKFYWQSALAILFPYLRSLVSDLTGKSDHQSVILPTLNIINVAKKYLNAKQGHVESKSNKEKDLKENLDIKSERLAE